MRQKDYDLTLTEKYGYVEKYRLFPSARATLALVGFVGCIMMYVMRVNLSVAIVCMTIEEDDNVNASITSTESNLHIEERMSHGTNSVKSNLLAFLNAYGGDVSSEEVCPGEGDGEAGADQETGEFDWDREVRGTINSSFFWGYILTQVIGGLLASKFGAKWILAIGFLILVATTFCSPPASHLGPYGLIAMRFLAGVGSGVYFPCFHHIWAEWAPPTERSFLLTFVLSGNSWGSVISFALSGFLCAELGWEWVFWMYGIWGLAWFIFWIFLAYDPPESHPRISDKELHYIKTSKLCEEKDDQKTAMKIPWVKILTSPCVLCIYLAQFCSSWGGNTTMTSLPQYMKDILKVDIKQNGLYNSLPPLCRFIFTIIFAIIADVLISKNILSIKAVRKIMQAIGFLIPAALLSIVGYLDCQYTGLVVSCLALAEGFTAGTRVGALTNILDIAPRFAGLLMGVGNSIATSAGIFAPIVAGYITSNGTQEEWRAVFFVGVFFYIIGFIFFTIFSEGKVQNWAIPPEVSKSEDISLDVCSTENSKHHEHESERF